VQYFEGVVHRVLYPLQVAVGVKGSGPKIVFGMRGMVEHFGPEGGVLRKVDVVNVFQEFDREDCLTAIDNPDPEFVSPEDAAALREPFLLAWQVLSVAPALYFDGGNFAGFHSQSGGTQGNPLACLFFCLSAQSSLLRAHSAAAEGGGTVGGGGGPDGWRLPLRPGRRHGCGGGGPGGSAGRS
jgi:hypothetical protein